MNCVININIYAKLVLCGSNTLVAETDLSLQGHDVPEIIFCGRIRHNRSMSKATQRLFKDMDSPYILRE